MFNVSGVQGKGEGGGKIRKGVVGSQGLVLHSFFPFFCLFTKIYIVFLKFCYTSIILHDMKWPYTVMDSHIHIRCYIDLNVNYTLT
jgi:hypothetical protein